MPSPPRPTHRAREPRPAALPALTGLRFFAAFGVLVYHFAQHEHLPWWGPARNLALYGYLGVPLFFILSGFVLAYNYFPAARAGRFERQAFWRARFARIYPIYAVALLLGAVGVYWRDQHAFHAGAYWATGIIETTLQQIWLSNPLHLTHYWNAADWTLSVEAYFYLAFPALLALGQWRRTRVLAWAGALGLVAAVNYPTVSIYGNWVGPFAYAALFLLGMVLARAHELGVVRRWCPAIAGLAAAAVLAIIGGNAGGKAGVEGASVVAFAVLIFGLAGDRGVVAHALAWPPLVALGEASYGLYILQMPLTLYLAHAWVVIHSAGWVRAAWTTDSQAYLVFYATVCIAASLASQVWLERPARAWLQRRWAVSKTSDSAVGATSGR